MAGCHRALQADGRGRAVGGVAPLADNDRLHCRIRQACQTALAGGHALCPDGLRGHVALAVFQRVAHQLQRKSCGQRRTDFQSLLSPDHHSRRQRDSERRGYVHLLQSVAAFDALLQFPAPAANHLRHSSHSSCGVAGLGRGTPALLLKRRLSGFPPHRSVYHPVRTLCLAGRLFQQHHPGKMADALRLQPHGRRHRRLPLGGAGQHSLSGVFVVGIHDHLRRSAVDRHSLLPKHRKNIRRRHLGEEHGRDHQG